MEGNKHFFNKADSFARQYVRITIEDAVNFVLFEIKARDYHVFTAALWEKELFRQLGELTKSLETAGRLNKDNQNSQDSLSQEVQELLQEWELVEDESKDGGMQFEVKVNPRKSEVRELFDLEKKPLLNEYRYILRNLCKEETTFDKYGEKVEEQKKKMEGFPFLPIFSCFNNH